MNMSVRLIKSAEQDDAAFRARLAPLASEVLPPTRAVPPPARASSLYYRNVIVTGMLAACVIAGAAWWFSGRMHLFGRAADSAAPVAAQTGGPTSAGGSAGGAASDAPAPAAPQRQAVVSAPAEPAGAKSSATGAHVMSAAQAVPAPATSAAGPTTNATTATAPSPAEAEIIGLLRRRGDAALAEGDIVTARLLFEQAADMGSPAAATAAGKTYDAEFLAQYGARGIRPDQAQAAAWFRKAIALGDVDAQEWLARIEGRPRP
jgi:TPR repeat protein